MMDINVNAIIVNRNLLTPLKHTLDFLSKDDRITTHIYDQASTYEPLLEFYKGVDNVLYSDTNRTPYSIWGLDLHKKSDYFILTDPDCEYGNVPDDWLDVMIEVLEKSDAHKVGFSLEINDIPDESEMKQSILNAQRRFWEIRNEFGWVADIDTTFALYRKNSGFRYNAIRLDRPYCVKHTPWYLDYKDLSDEWEFYIRNVNRCSVWGNKIKKRLTTENML